VGRREVRDLILELRRKGKTVCFSTHILADVEALCDRVGILNRGQLHGLGTLDEILKLQTRASEVLVCPASPALRAALEKLAEGIHTAGDKLVFTVTPDKVFAVAECVKQNGGTLLAVTPVRASLEDYFFEAFGTEKVPELTVKR
jgi:ABC-2 type transport system ATP-binding protein